MSIFSNYAKYYDLLNQGKDYSNEVEYINSIIKQYRPSSKNILDLGCGTGMHAIHFAKKGYSIHGIDQSDDMILIANNQITSKPEYSNKIKFSVGDLRNYTVGENFDVVLALFHVMSYQVTDDDLINSISNVAKHTSSGSLFIFDCWYGPAVLTDKPYSRTKTFEDEDLLVKRTAIPKMHPTRNMVDVTFDISILDKKSKEMDSFYELHRMRYLFEPEMKRLLSENSFEFIKSEEWMTGEKPENDTWYVTFICRKL